MPWAEFRKPRSGNGQGCRTDEWFVRPMQEGEEYVECN